MSPINIISLAMGSVEYYSHCLKNEIGSKRQRQAQDFLASMSCLRGKVVRASRSSWVCRSFGVVRPRDCKLHWYMLLN